MSSEIKRNNFDNTKALDEALSEYISKLLEKNIEKKGEASLILSGGSTPKNMLSLLSQKDIQWNKVYVTLADERWISVKSKDSNEKMIRSVFLQNHAQDANFIGLKQRGSKAHEVEQECDKALWNFPFPATVALLGMGEDGHTASIFPHAPELTNIIYEKSLVVKACTPQTADYMRMTLTPEVLGNSSKIILHIVGAKKRAVLKEALNGGDIFDMPIRLFLANPRLEVFCDES